MTVLDEARGYIAKGWSVIPLMARDKTPDYSVLPQKQVNGQLIWMKNGEEVTEDTGYPKHTWSPYTQRHATDTELVEWFGEGSRNIGIVTGKVSNIVVVDLDGPDAIVEADKLGLRSPIMVNTGRGRHLYMAYPQEGAGNSVKKIGANIDTRGDAGYVVAPPSIHPSGHVYQWVIGDGAMPVFNSTLTAKAAGPANSPGWIAEELAAMRPGYRDVPLTKIVGRMHRDGWAPADMKAVLLSNPEVMAHGESELDRIVRSISAKPRSLDTGELPTENLVDFLTTEEKVEWIVSGIVARNAMGLMAGLPETCKTWCLMDLAIEAARGGVWLGKFAAKKAKVLFVDQERFAAETKRRFKALLKGKGLSPANLNNSLEIWCGTTVRIDLEHSYESFRRRLAAIRPDLVIVDSFATFHTKEENSRTELQIVMERIKKLRQEFGCTFLFIDHEVKSVFNAEVLEEPSAMRMAGSVAKPAAAELVLTVRSKGKSRSAVYHTKSTLGPAVDSFLVEVVDVDGDPSQIVVKAVD